MLNKKAFTLVELIVVITILAILGTIAFISLQGYSRDARDSVRLSDTASLNKGLDLYMAENRRYPSPDGAVRVNYNLDLLWSQGYLGDSVFRKLSKTMGSKITDPLIKNEYIYSLANNGKEYEILTLLEGKKYLKNKFINPFVKRVNAKDVDVYPKISGNYNGVFIKTGNYLVPTPSIINAEVNSSDINLNNTNIKSQVVTGKGNIPDIPGINSKNRLLDNLELSVYSGSISTYLEDTEKQLVMETIQNAYLGSEVENNIKIKFILNTETSNELVSMFDELVLKIKRRPGLKTGYGDWRDLDPNCNKPDVKIGEQYWAGCNSTLGNGFEYSSTGGCYNYDKDSNGSNQTDGTLCGEGDLGNSNDNALSYYNSLDGTLNPNGDIEVDNIWGKLYTWEDRDSACPTGYHVPSNDEWEYAEEYLYEEGGGSTNCRSNTLNSWECSGIGWKFHSTTNKSSNLVNKLNIPLSGDINSHGNVFNYRGYRSLLWSSIDYDLGNAYFRYIYYGSESIGFRYGAKSSSMSIRCIKD